MVKYSDSEKQVLTQLQRGIEITSRPFQGLEDADAVSAPRYPCSEEEVLALLLRAKEDGLLRRFGGVFDARRLGYKSVLCALDCPPDQIEEKAAIIVEHPGVTHCYERRPMNCRAGMVTDLPSAAGLDPRERGFFQKQQPQGVATSATVPALQKENNYPALWFTLAMLHDEFEAGISSLRSQLTACHPQHPTRNSQLETRNFHLPTRNSKLFELPALRRFKIDVVFDLQTRDRDEIFPGIDPVAAPVFDESFRTFSPEEKELVRALDQQIPLVARPFAALAEQLGQTEEFVLSTLNEWKEQGVLRRIGAVLYHREAGFTANAMCVWPVEGDVAEAGRRMAARPEVTHCYQRPRLETFPFDLYAMIHAGSWEQAGEQFNTISRDCGLSGGAILASVREFKKSSMKYFREE
ncbi:MAG: hypothetical protein MUC65_00525 [Pontiellaceae bacterium]|jgi:DNA-binding Lrp family transcriptional regulator|nr:hypothetical protein [Pontiellaceae bacterium]